MTGLAPPIESALDAPGIVFLRATIGWDRRANDMEAHTGLVERWRPTFPKQLVLPSTATLASADDGCRVLLTPEVAQFQAQTADGFHRTLELISQLFEMPAVGTRPNMRVVTDVQYVRSGDSAFDVLTNRMAMRTLSSEFLPSIGAKLLDFAYLTDVLIEKDWYQLHFGPIRSDEVRRRVFATNLQDPPSVALFLQVTSRWKPTVMHVTEFETRIERLVHVGNTTIRELIS